MGKTFRAEKGEQFKSQVAEKRILDGPSTDEHHAVQFYQNYGTGIFPDA